MAVAASLGQPLSGLAGIGSKTAEHFAKLRIYNLSDLLLHLPSRYEDRTRIIPINQLSPGNSALIVGTIDFIDVLPRGRKSLICQIKDDTGTIHLRFFHFTARQYNALKPGTTLICYGEVRYGYNGLEMLHPDYKIATEHQPITPESSLTAIYPLVQGLHQNVVRKAIKTALTLANNPPQNLQEWLPESVLQTLALPDFRSALNTLHLPQPATDLDYLTNDHSPARRRLALEELLAHHLSVKTAKLYARSWQAPKLLDNSPDLAKFVSALPFSLTTAQSRVIGEIIADCQRQHPMMRLVQGDVGSGKTVVAAYAAILAVTSGYQVAIMAPTELLAEQHYRNFCTWLTPLATEVALLTGHVKGKARSGLLQQLADGDLHILIGTHALFQDDVHFNRLGLVIIDEQHRFGVHQRLALRAKGQHNNLRPHQLIMTATPIPRTLAMLRYSDLDISSIDELPPGRKPITTSVIASERRQEVIGRIAAWVGKKRQAYWVCTLIEESDVLQCEAAEKTAACLTQALPDIRIGLLHGRMKNADKEATMLAFKNNAIDLLVATTVIEVGVDIPNASLMIIENPERLGLSQLHQLRGRVGRGADESYCLLLYQAPLSDTARQRLGILRESQDGFLIAEKDLQLRGPGEVMGIRQTGQINFKVADLVKHADLLDNIPAIADQLVAEAPEAITPLIKRWLGHTTDYSEV
jgi:ATP-dependent DNA helicase RecG